MALGVRPADPLIQSLPQHISQTTRRSPAVSPAGSPGQPPFFAASGHDVERGPDFRAHKAAFFFKLERELEKVLFDQKCHPFEGPNDAMFLPDQRILLAKRG